MSEHNTHACGHGHRDPPPRRPDRSIADADRRRRPSADAALPRVRSHIFPPSRACPHPPTHTLAPPHIHPDAIALAHPRAVASRARTAARSFKKDVRSNSFFAAAANDVSDDFVSVATVRPRADRAKHAA